MKISYYNGHRSLIFIITSTEKRKTANISGTYGLFMQQKLYNWLYIYKHSPYRIAANINFPARV